LFLSVICDFGTLWNITNTHRRIIQPLHNIILTYDTTQSNAVLPCTLDIHRKSQNFSTSKDIELDTENHYHTSQTPENKAILNVIYYTSNHGGHTQERQIGFTTSSKKKRNQTLIEENRRNPHPSDLLNTFYQLDVVGYKIPSSSIINNYMIISREEYQSLVYTASQVHYIQQQQGGYGSDPHLQQQPHISIKSSQGQGQDPGYIDPRDVPPYPSSFTFGRLIDPAIELRYIDNFLTDEECDELIKFSDDKFVESLVVEKDNSRSKHEGRTSTTAYIYKNSNPIADAIETRTAKLLQGNESHIEGLQVVRYMPGQQFTAHYDWFMDDYKVKIQNQRLYTVFAYLNDVTEGGETAFPRLNHSFSPRRGDALFWRDAADINTPLVDSLHAGMPPTGNTTIKYGLNIWYNFRPLNTYSP